MRALGGERVSSIVCLLMRTAKMPVSERDVSSFNSSHSSLIRNVI